MPNTITVAPAVIRAIEFVSSDSGAKVAPINTHIPPSALSGNAALAAAFTPSGTSVTINPTGFNAVTFTNATAREFICMDGHLLAEGLYFRASARRKPGTTGAIVAQTVVFTVNSVEVGRFNVEAAAAGADPVCGAFELTNTVADTRFDITTNNLVCGVTAADTDIEIFFLLFGNQ